MKRFCLNLNNTENKKKHTHKRTRNNNRISKTFEGASEIQLIRPYQGFCDYLRSNKTQHMAVKEKARRASQRITVTPHGSKTALPPLPPIPCPCPLPPALPLDPWPHTWNPPRTPGNQAGKSRYCWWRYAFMQVAFCCVLFFFVQRRVIRRRMRDFHSSL